MIKFSGRVTSEGCLQFIKKRETENVRMIAFIVITLFGAMITALALMASKWFFLMLVPLLAVLLLMFPQAGIEKRLPISVEIGDDYIAVETEQFSQTFDLVDVKKVVDKGDWYHILFHRPNMTPYFACQKDLLVEGTLEEFEKIFEDKLVREDDI